MKHNLMTAGQLFQNGYKVLIEIKKCVIHEKDAVKKIIGVVQMTRNRMFPIRIETCFSSQNFIAPLKNACTIVHQQSAIKSKIEDPSKQ